MKKLLLALGLIMLFAAEIGKVYVIMPFPGSQKSDTIGLAYFLHNYIWYIRILAALLIIYGVSGRFKRWRMWQKTSLIIVLLFYSYVFYMFNFKFLADKMFYQPETKSFASASDNNIPNDKLVIATVINGEAKAYPIQLIGYHHQVQDTIGGEPVIVTYCTVCRTGRIYSPMIDGKKEQFRLVGMDHFNAMFEDATTKSWWRQVTGEAITGPMKGKRLTEIPSLQVSLQQWIASYPNTKILQRDTLFNQAYDDLAKFDNGTIESGLEKRDSASWQFKSWVVGIDNGKAARAYDWNDIVKDRVINDSLPGLPVAIVLEPDSISFRTYNRTLSNGQTVHLVIDDSTKLLRDTRTNTIWNFTGQRVDSAAFKLAPVQSYQEFWHSWQTFHPATSQYHK